MQRAAERRREVGVAHGLGRDRVDRPGVARVAERREVDRDDVVERDPRHPLPPMADAAAREQLERRRHLRDRAARADDEPGAHAAHAHAQRLGSRGLALPVATHAAEERVRRWIGLGDLVVVHRLVRVRVVVGARCGHERLRPLGHAGSAAIASTSPRVASTRLSRIFCFCRASQRAPAIGSPARFTIASAPTSAAVHAPRPLSSSAVDRARSRRRAPASRAPHRATAPRPDRPARAAR